MKAQPGCANPSAACSPMRIADPTHRLKTLFVLLSCLIMNSERDLQAGSPVRFRVDGQITQEVIDAKMNAAAESSRMEFTVMAIGKQFAIHTVKYQQTSNELISYVTTSTALPDKSDPAVLRGLNRKLAELARRRATDVTDPVKRGWTLVLLALTASLPLVVILYRKLTTKTKLKGSRRGWPGAGGGLVLRAVPGCDRWRGLGE
jgi:hypothetical protein